MHGLNVLVAGSSGFIGSHVADALLREGFLVCVVDDLSSSSRANMTQWENHAASELIVEDLKNLAVTDVRHKCLKNLKNFEHQVRGRTDVD